MRLLLEGEIYEALIGGCSREFARYSMPSST